MTRKHPLARCEECPLAEHGRYVPSSGPEKAELAFVGEAPGIQEAKQGVPFTGPSGKLLKTVLEHHDIDQEKVFLSNACLCRPPGNDTPPKSAVTACRPRLIDELQSRGSNTVMALGNTAAQSLLGIEGITKLRVGPGKTSPHLGDGVRVIPSIHPAACLRQGDMFPSLVTDVGKVVHQIGHWVDPTFRVFDNVGEAQAVLSELYARDTGPLVVDIEVDIDKDNSFDHPDRYHLLSIAIAYGPSKAIVLGENAVASSEVCHQVGQLLRKTGVVAHNGKFDLAGLYRHCGAIPLVFDTMLASYALDERPGIHGLKYLAVEFLGAPQYDADIKRYVGPKDGYGNIPRELLYRYNAFDAVCTYQLYELFSVRLDNESGHWPYTDLPVKRLRDVHEFLVDASEELMYVELNGIAVDRAYLDELTVQYLDSLSVIEQEVDEWVKTATEGKTPLINPRSPKQVTEALSEMDIRVGSTDEATLKTILTRLEPDSPKYGFIEALLRHRREAKLYGTYVKGVRKRLFRGRVYPTFLLHGTTTGRLACRNPNLQNIPRESSIRTLYVPSRPEVNVFGHVDFKQAELRVLTWLARDEYFREIFDDPSRDLFDELAPVLYGSIDHMRPEDRKELRIRVKAYVYGLSYGREAYSIAQEFKIPTSEAEKNMDLFFSTIPSIVKFRAQVLQTIHKEGQLITPFGRIRRFPLITKENRQDVEREGLAFLPQSTAADMTTLAFTWVRPKLKGTGCYIRNLIHDDMLFESPIEKAEWCAQLIREHMIEAAKTIVGDYVKFDTDYKIGNSWGEM